MVIGDFMKQKDCKITNFIIVLMILIALITSGFVGYVIGLNNADVDKNVVRDIVYKEKIINNTIEPDCFEEIKETLIEYERNKEDLKTIMKENLG